MNWKEKLVFGIGAGVLFIATLSIVSIIAAIPVYYLWNWLMPELFAIKAITFLQAWGVNLLAGVLFKSNSSSKSNKG